MKIIKKSKQILLILLILIPTAMLFSFLIRPVNAGPDIPENPYIDPNNEWHWEVNVNDELIYELEMEVYDNETGELISAFKSIHIFKINSFNNITYQGTEVSEVNANQFYYDCESNSLKQLGNPIQLALFGYDDTDEPNEKYFLTEGIIAPFIIPRNGTTQDFDDMTNILNETFYDQYQNGNLNYFDYAAGNTGGYNISMQGTNNPSAPYRTGDWWSTDFYVRIIYDSSDKLIFQDTSILILEEEGNPEAHWRLYNYTIKKVDDYDILDEIDWGVKKGDTFYYGYSDYNKNNPEFSEVKIEVNGFNYSMEEVMTYFGPMNMTFQNVLGNLSMWNEQTGTYDLATINETLGSANNFYPFIPGIIAEDMAGILPNDIDKTDLQFMGDYFSMEGGISDVPDENELEILFPEENYRFLIKLNETGIVNLWLKEEEGYITKMLFRKENVTIIDEIYDYGFKPITVENHIVNLSLTTDPVTELELYYSVLAENFLEPLGVPFYEEIQNFTIYIDAYTNKSNAVEWANLTIEYDDWELDNSDIPEDKIKVYTFNESKWIELTEDVNYTRDTDNNEIEINAKHLSFFAIGAPEEWNWSSEINIGDEMYYETTGKLDGNLSEDMGIVTLPFVDFYILNVTNIGQSYKDRGDGKGDAWMNQINCNLLYWDPAVKDLVKFDESGEFVLSEYNYSSSLDPQFYLNLTEHTLGFPIAVPLRFNRLHLMSIGVALNDSFYSSVMARDIGLPIWDEIVINPYSRTLTFNDTTSDYYMALTYYGNGTLEKAEFSVEFNIESNIIKFNLTTIRTDDYNQTNEVEWGVEVGKSYYFGSNFPMGGPTIEINVTIVEINQTAIFLRDLVFGHRENGNGDDGGPPIFQSWLTFSNVWAKIEVWNITSDKDGIQIGEWVDLTEIDEYANETIIIGAANNYYPFPIGDYLRYYNLSGFFIPMIIPKGIDAIELAETYGDLLSFYALFMFEGEVIPQVTLNTTDLLRIDMTSPTDPSLSAFIEWYIDADTGVSKYWYVYARFEGEEFIANVFRKNHTIVNNADGINPKKITFEFDNYIIDDVNATVTVEYLGNFSFLEAVLYNNPVNNSMSSAYGNPMFFTDLFFINYTNDPYNLTFRLDLPSRFPVGKIEYLATYQYDPTNREAGRWNYDKLTDITFGTFTRDVANNNITLEINNLNGSLVIIVAWMFLGPRGGIPADSDDGGDEAEAVIPGYNIYILIGILSLISLAIIFKKRYKITEIFKN